MNKNTSEKLELTAIELLTIKYRLRDLATDEFSDENHVREFAALNIAAEVVGQMLSLLSVTFADETPD